MTATSIKLLFAAILLSCPAAGASASQPSTPSTVSIDDLMEAESLTGAWYSPDGDQILFARSLSMAERRDRRAASEYLFSRVFVAEANGGESREIVPPEGTIYSPIFGEVWAPDARGALLFATSEGKYQLAFWDRASSKVTILPGRPRSAMPIFAWAGGHILYASLPPAIHQTFSNRDLLEGLTEQWSRAWTGDDPQITISSTSPIMRKMAPPAGSLMIANPRTGAAEKVAEGDYVALQPSSDGRHIAAVRLMDDLADSIEPGGRRGELQVFAIRADGKLSLLHSAEDLDVSGDALAWSPDGERLLFQAKPLGQAKTQARPYALDMKSGLSRSLVEATITFLQPDINNFRRVMPVGWIGRYPVAIGGREGQAAAAAPALTAKLDYGVQAKLRFDLYVLVDGTPVNLTSFAKNEVSNFLAPKGSDHALVIADGALWRVGVGVAPQKLFAPDRGAILGFDIHPRRPWLSMESAYHARPGEERVALIGIDGRDQVQHLTLDLDTGQAEPLAAPGELVVRAPDLIDNVSEVSRNWESDYVLSRNGTTDKIASVNSDLAGKVAASLQSFSYQAGGRELTGWVALPPGTNPGEKLPAIAAVYGGAVWGAQPPRFAKTNFFGAAMNGQLLAAHGYAVVYPSLPLGPGATTDVMAALAESAVAAIDALAAKGIIDPARVGVTGMSFGGFSTAAILATRSDRFKAGVAQAGVYDFISAYGRRNAASMLSPVDAERDLSIFSIEDSQIRLGKPFWLDPAPYIRNSPIFHVDKMDSPLLILHGDLDLGTTSYGDAERLYKSLVRAGKEAALVRYWGEGHTVQSAWAQRDQAERMIAWFDHYLRAGAQAVP